MKKLLIIWALILALGLFSAPAFAAHYVADFLESGNPGGWTASLKTLDDAAGTSVSVGDTFNVDIWMRNASGAATNGGFWIEFDGKLLSITAVDAYNGVDLSGPWAGPAGKVPNPTRNSPADSYSVTLANLGTPVAQDIDGDIITARVTFECTTAGESAVQVETIHSYDTWAPSPPWYDAEIEPSNFTIICGGGAGDGDECEGDADCDDGEFCNGEEICVDGTCQQGTNPCPGQICHEDTNSCESTPATTTTIKTGSEMPDITDNSMATISDKAVPPSSVASPASITKLSSKTATTLPIAIPSSSSPYKVVISPSSVTLDPGGMVQFSARTILDGGEAEGTYVWKIVSASPIGSTIDENGLLIAGNNITDSNVQETVWAIDTSHENNNATVKVTITIEKQHSAGCELSISPSSATIFSEDTIKFFSKNIGERCAEALYDWKINSKIGSQINANGLYTAGNNVSDDAAIDIIIINDTVNKTRTDAIVTVLSKEKAANAVPDPTQKPQQKSLAGRGPYSTVLIIVLAILFLIAVLLFRKIKR